MTDLLSLQRRFHRALRGEAAALDGLVPDAARRLTVHRTTIDAGLGANLAGAFPALRRVVGAMIFAQLSADFIAKHPPREPVLSAYGRGFPAFIAAQPIAASLPYLHDLARLEWERQESFHAADAAPLDAGHLRNDPDALATMRLRVHPAARVLSSPFPIHRIWRLNQADVETKDIPSVDMTVAEHVAVTRPAAEVVTRQISLADATLVRAIAGGASLSEAVEAAFAVSHDFDVTQALAGHFANGTFSSP